MYIWNIANIPYSFEGSLPKRYIFIKTDNYFASNAKNIVSMRNIAVLLIFQLFNSATSNEHTTCQQNQKLFTDLCFSPKPDLDWDFEWFQSNQPEEGWYSEIGNDVYQLHFSEVIKKEVLSPDDDFTDMCYRFYIDHGTGDGKLHGYNGLSSNWSCVLSKDFHGVQICDLQLNHDKFHENSITYIAYHDKKTKFAIVIDCFPNGQVGWASISKHRQLTEDERKIVYDYAVGLGFKNDTVAILHGDHCPNVTTVS